MFTIVLGALAGIGFIIFRIKTYNERKELLKELLNNNKYELFDNSRLFIIILAIIGIVSVVSLAYTIINWDETNVALSFLLVCLAIEEIINAVDTQKFYYNSTGTILGNKLVRYKSIKSIDQKRNIIPIPRYIVKTINGEEFVIPKKFSLILKEQMQLKEAK